MTVPYLLLRWVEFPAVSGSPATCDTRRDNVGRVGGNMVRFGYLRRVYLAHRLNSSLKCPKIAEYCQAEYAVQRLICEGGVRTLPPGTPPYIVPSSALGKPPEPKQGTLIQG